MKALRLLLAFTAGICFLSSAMATEQVYLLGLRHRTAQLAELCAAIPNCVVPDAPTSEYTPKGFTGVKINAPLSQHQVLIEVPDSVTADDLMELFIKTRTAQSNGARRITLVCRAPLSQLNIYKLPIERLFSVAGASHVLDPSTEAARPISRSYAPLREGLATQSFIMGSTHPELQSELAGLLALNEFKIGDTVDLSKSQIIYVAALAPPVNENFFRTMGDVNYLAELGAWPEVLTTLYPYGRSDKIDSPGTTIVGKLAADLIKALGPASITFMRAHAAQSEGFFQPLPTYHLSGRPTLIRYLKTRGIQAVIAPDNGALKDSGRLAEDMGLVDGDGHLILGNINKKRNLRTGEISFHGISGASIAGLRAVMADDEGDTGGTTGEGADYALSQDAAKGAEIYGAFVHLTGRAAKAIAARKRGSLRELIVTNTLPIPADLRPELTVLSAAPEIADSFRPRLVRNYSAAGDVACEVAARQSLLSGPR